MSELPAATARDPNAVVQIAAAAVPTLRFIGVSTTQSAIMQVFPLWAEALGLRGAGIAGFDLPIGAPASEYRETVAFLRDDPLTQGALVTTHKLDLFATCRDLFDRVDPLAELMREVSCLAKPAPGRLAASAKDPITAGLAIDGWLDKRHFERTGAELFIMGAGGSAIAIAWHLTRPGRGSDRPSRVTVSDPDTGRLKHFAAVQDELRHGVPARTVAVADALHNDVLLASLPPGSLVVNATGLGKDRPGSPLGPGCQFPERGIAWELNYRGALGFLHQARAQRSARGLQVEDGWTYFIHGWSQVIAEVFAIPVDGRGPIIGELSRLAASLRPASQVA